VGGVEDALDDHVVPVVKTVTGHQVDQADVRAAGDVVLSQYDPAQVVLPHDGDATPVPGPYLSGNRRLTARGVPSYHDEPRRG
jgi:hypothetical protein